MPTSKNILDDAEKTYKNNQLSARVTIDIVKQAQDDIAAFAKANAELSASVRSMKTFLEASEGTLKKLNAGLTELKKNEAVMKAPADAVRYKKLIADYVAEIKEGMDQCKKVTQMHVKALEYLKK